MKYTVHSGESEFEVDIDRQGVVRIGGEVIEADLCQVSDSPFYSLLLGQRSYELRIELSEDCYQFQIEGVSLEVTVEDERTRVLAGVKSASGSPDTNEAVIKSPMPGVIIDLPVKQGDQVQAGQLLIVVESMKMHNEFTAPRAGTVKAVRVSLGDKVLQNTILVTIS